MQVCTITQAVHLRKLHGRAEKRAPWMRIAAVHGGGIQTKDAVDLRTLYYRNLLRDPARHRRNSGLTIALGGALLQSRRSP